MLQSLVQSPGSHVNPAGRVIDVDRLTPHPKNVRQEYDHDELIRLGESMKKYGVVHPLLVRPDPQRDGAFQIVSGHRRWMAAREVGIRALPATVADLDDAHTDIIVLVANIQTQELAEGEIEAALGRWESEGKSRSEIGEMLHKSASWVTIHMRALEDKVVAPYLLSGQINSRQASEASRAENPAVKLALIEQARSGASARDLRIERFAALPPGDRPMGDKSLVGSLVERVKQNAFDYSGPAGDTRRQVPLPELVGSLREIVWCVRASISTASDSERENIRALANELIEAVA